MCYRKFSNMIYKIIFLASLTTAFTYAEVILEKDFKFSQQGTVLIALGARIKNSFESNNGVRLLGPYRGNGTSGCIFLVPQEIEAIPEKIGDELHLTFRKKSYDRKKALITVSSIEGKIFVHIKLPQNDGLVAFKKDNTLFVAFPYEFTYDPENLLTKRMIKNLKKYENLTLLKFNIKERDISIDRDQNGWIIGVSQTRFNKFQSGAFFPVKIEKKDDTLIFSGQTPFEIPDLPYIFIPNPGIRYHFPNFARFPKFHILKTYQGTVIDKRNNDIRFETFENKVKIYSPEGLKLAKMDYEPTNIILPLGGKIGDLSKLQPQVWVSAGLEVIARAINTQRYGKKAQTIYDQVQRRFPVIEEHLIWNFFNSVGSILEADYAKGSLDMPIHSGLLDSTLWHAVALIYLEKNLSFEIFTLFKKWDLSQLKVKANLGLALADYLRYKKQITPAKFTLAKLTTMLEGETVTNYFNILDGFMNDKYPQDLIRNFERGNAYRSLNNYKAYIDVIDAEDDTIASKLGIISTAFSKDMIEFQARMLLARFYEIRKNYLSSLEQLEKILFNFPEQSTFVIKKIKELISTAFGDQTFDYLEKIIFFNYVYIWIDDSVGELKSLINSGLAKNGVFILDLLNKYIGRIKYDSEINKTYLKLMFEFRDFNNFEKVIQFIPENKEYYTALYCLETKQLEKLDQLLQKNWNGKERVSAFIAWKKQDFVKCYEILNTIKIPDQLMVLIKMMCTFMLNDPKLFLDCLAKKKSEAIFEDAGIQNAEITNPIYRKIANTIALYFNNSITGEVVLKEILDSTSLVKKLLVNL